MTTDYVTDDQLVYAAHGYGKRTISHSIFIVQLILAEQLSYRDNLVVKLRFKDGMTYKEIAKIITFKTPERPRQIVAKACRIVRSLYPRYKREFIKS